MKIFVIQQGMAIKRHYNAFNIFTYLIKNKFKYIKIDIGYCNWLLKACDTRICSSDNELGGKYPKIKWAMKCMICKWHISKNLHFIDEEVELTGYINKKEIDDIKIVLDDFFKNGYSLKKIINFEYCGINVGKDIWSSIQRYFLISGTAGLTFAKNSIEYEYFKSGLKLAVVYKNLFQKIKYDYVITNEMTYINNGIAVKLARKNNIPVIHQSWNYVGYEYLVFKKYSSKDKFVTGIGDPDYLDYLNILNNKSLAEEFLNNGKSILKDFTKNYLSIRENKDLISKLYERYPSINKNKKNIVIYTHLAWDASLGHYMPIFDTFEEFYAAIIELAKDNLQYNFIFKIHPAEIADNNVIKPVSDTVGDVLNVGNKLHSTSSFIKNLIDSNDKLENVTIYEENNNDILSIIDLCLTVHGTIKYQLAAVGVPVLLAESSNAISDQWNYCSYAKNWEEFIVKFHQLIAQDPKFNIDKSNEGIIYCAMLHDKNRFLDISNYFNNSLEINSKILTKDEINKVEYKDNLLINDIFLN